MISCCFDNLPPFVRIKNKNELSFDAERKQVEPFQPMCEVMRVTLRSVALR